MAKKDRTGNRKTRDQRKQFKVPELGYYLIVTDTEATERCDYTFDMGGGCRNTIVKGYSCGYIMVKWYEK